MPCRTAGGYIESALMQSFMQKGTHRRDTCRAVWHESVQCTVGGPIGVVTGAYACRCSSRAQLASKEEPAGRACLHTPRGLERL